VDTSLGTPATRPRVPEEVRVRIARLTDDFMRVDLTFGYLEPRRGAEDGSVQIWTLGQETDIIDGTAHR
jgi:hypothetical protein